MIKGEGESGRDIVSDGDVGRKIRRRVLDERYDTRVESLSLPRVGSYTELGGTQTRYTRTWYRAAEEEGCDDFLLLSSTTNTKYT